MRKARATESRALDIYGIVRQAQIYDSAASEKGYP